MSNGGVGVDFDEPQFEFFVDHEIHTVEFKIEAFFL